MSTRTLWEIAEALMLDTRPEHEDCRSLARDWLEIHKDGERLLARAEKAENCLGVASDLIVQFGKVEFGHRLTIEQVIAVKCLRTALER